MRRFKVTEIRKTIQGKLFAVDTIYEAEDEEELRARLENSPTILDKKFRIKEIREGQLKWRNP